MEATERTRSISLTYVATTLFVTLSAVVGLLVSWASLPSWAMGLEAILSPLHPVSYECRYVGWMSLVVGCIAIAFWHGYRTLGRCRLSAVVIGWALPSVLMCAWEGVPSFLSLPVVVVCILALVTLSAHRGRLYAESRATSHVFWLLAVLLAISLVFVLNRQIFGLVPDRLRWQVWHCPL